MGIEERRQREFDRRERELLDAALALFDDDGWDQVTVAEIARRAEIGKGTVYKHFPSKDEIYARLSLDFGRTLFDQFAAIDPTTTTPTRAVRSLLRIGLRHHLDNPQYTRVVRYTERRDFRTRLSKETQEAFADLDRKFVELITGVLERGMAKGTFARKPVGQHIVALTATFQGALEIATNGACDTGFLEEAAGQLDAETLATTVTEFMLAGLSAAGARETTEEFLP